MEILHHIHSIGGPLGCSQQPLPSCQGTSNASINILVIILPDTVQAFFF